MGNAAEGAARWPELGRLLDLAGRYGVFLVDQFGTLHDGHAAYAGAVESLRALRATGARVVLLSNSGKRASASTSRLTRLGITPDVYDASVTSGEVGWHRLRDDAARGARRCLLIERGESGSLDGLDLERVEDAAQADLLVIAGSLGDERSLDSYDPVLAAAARAGLPCFCFNPDRWMVTPSGLFFGSGQIAERYAELGGSVTWIGKPYPAVYEFALAGTTGRERVVGVGDSLEHDVAGAQHVNGHGWLVRSGILATADDDAIAAECARCGVTPDGILRRI